MIRAYILDDEPPAVKAIEALLKRYENNFPVDILGSSNQPKDSIEAIESLKPNVLFLDIEMPEQTGFELLEKVQHPELLVVFVTAYREYAVDAFDAHALHYLVKPISPHQFYKCLEKIDQRLNSGILATKKLEQVPRLSESKSTAIKTREGYEIVPYDEIVRVKSEGAYSEFYLRNGKKLVQSKNMKQSIKGLPATYFRRISRSAIININQMVSFSFQDGGSIFMSNGEELLVGKTYRSEVFNFLRAQYSL